MQNASFVRSSRYDVMRRTSWTHLLVVESGESIRGVHETHFARAGFEVRSVATLGEALRCTSQIAFDAVIADAGFDAEASVNGLALLSHLRSRHDQWVRLG